MNLPQCILFQLHKMKHHDELFLRSAILVESTSSTELSQVTISEGGLVEFHHIHLTGPW